MQCLTRLMDDSVKHCLSAAANVHLMSDLGPTCQFVNRNKILCERQKMPPILRKRFRLWTGWVYVVFYGQTGT